MIRWAVTGPIGAGKSTVTRHLAGRGAVVIDADKLGHEVLAEPEVVKRLREEFGPDVAPDGQVDRSVLGPRVFADPQALDRLNALTHGRISDLAVRRFDQLAAEGKHELAVLEAAVYFLFPSPPQVDLVVSVVAEPGLRARRLVAERGLDARQAAARLAAQDGLADLWARADVVLENNGSTAELLRRVDRLLDEQLGNRYP